MSEVEEKTEFKFSELSDTAKQHAIEQNAAPDYEWWDSTYEHFKEEGKAKGFEIDDINFSGFYRQGDGASWSGRVDMSVYLEAQLEKAEGIEYTRLTALVSLMHEGDMDRYASITKSGRGEHEMTMQIVGLEVRAWEEWESLREGPLQGADVQTLLQMYATEKMLGELEAEVLEAARDYAREIYKALEADYDSYFEEENFGDLAEANEWTFDENGKMV